MTTPILHYPARSRVASSTYILPSQRIRPPFAVAPATTGRRAMRRGACAGASIVGGMGLAVGCVVLAVSWLLAAETHSGELLGAAEWAASVTTLGAVAGGIGGAVVGAFVGAATRAMRRANDETPSRERMKVA